MMHHLPYMTTGKTGRHGKGRHATIVFICDLFVSRDDPLMS